MKRANEHERRNEDSHSCTLANTSIVIIVIIYFCNKQSTTVPVPYKCVVGAHDSVNCIIGSIGGVIVLSCFADCWKLGHVVEVRNLNKTRGKKRVNLFNHIHYVS